ncbi:MAG: hypothetical protein EON49_00495 [Acidovorax sp.]|nr:MAG: hypothetical protein EON49_00495 [Acidovorax sp.]
MIQTLRPLRPLRLSHDRAALAPMANTAQRRQLPPGPAIDLFEAIVLAWIQTRDKPAAVCANYFTPAAAIEDRHPCA